MNLFQLQERLKDFSQDQLVNEMRNPSGSAPQYLVLSELQRRRRLMQEEQAQMPQQQSTVAEEAVAAAGMPQGGLAQMAQALAPQTDVAMNTARMAEGGKIRRDVYERNRPREVEEDIFRMMYDGPPLDDFRGMASHDTSRPIIYGRDVPLPDDFRGEAYIDPTESALRRARAQMRIRADERYEADLRDALSAIGSDYEGMGARESSLREEDDDMRDMIESLMRSQSETVSGFAEGGMTSFPTFDDAGTDEFDEYLIIENIMRDAIPADEALPGGMSDELRDELARRRAMYTDRKREGGMLSAVQTPGGGFPLPTASAANEQFNAMIQSGPLGSYHEYLTETYAEPRVNNFVGRVQQMERQEFGRGAGIQPLGFGPVSQPAYQPLPQPIMPRIPNQMPYDTISGAMLGRATNQGPENAMQPPLQLAEGGVVRMQPGGLAGISANLTDFMPIGPASGRTAARGAGRYANITPGQIGGTIAVDALLSDPRILEAAARSELSPEDYISRLNPDQFSSAIEMLSQPIEPPTVRDEASFELAGQPVPELSPAGLSQSGLTGVEPVPVVSREDILAAASLPENRTPVTDEEIFQVVGAPFVAEMEALADPELEGITEEAARRLGELYVGGVEAAAETPLGLPSFEETLDATRGTSAAITGALAERLGFEGVADEARDVAREELTDTYTPRSASRLPINTGTSLEVPEGGVEALLPPLRLDSEEDGGAGGAGGAGGGAAPEVDDLYEQDKWLALAQFGLGLMSSTAPTFGQALGEAGTTGIAALRQARADRQDRLDTAQARADRLAAAAARGRTSGLTADQMADNFRLQASAYRDIAEGILERSLDGTMAGLSEEDRLAYVEASSAADILLRQSVAASSAALRPAS